MPTPGDLAFLLALLILFAGMLAVAATFTIVTPDQLDRARLQEDRLGFGRLVGRR